MGLTNCQPYAIIKSSKRDREVNKMSCEKCPYNDYGWCCIEGGDIPDDAICYAEENEE